jgi:fucose permease
MSTTTEKQASAAIWMLTAGSFFAFFVFGFVDNLKGATLSSVLRDLDFSYSQGGAILLSAYVGFLIATLASGPLADAAGNKVVMVLAGLALCTGIGFYSIAAELHWLAAAMGIIGLGLGAIEVGGNALIVMLYKRRRGRFLNLLGVFHGTGSMLVPIYAALLLSSGLSWRLVYRYSLILPIILTGFFIFVRFPTHSQDGEHGMNLAKLRESGLSRRMALFYSLFAVYVAAELGVAAWIVEFLQEVKGFSLARSSLYLSLFFGAIMLGRLAGSTIVDRMGYLRVMWLATIAALLTLTAGIFGPPPAAILIPLTGLFFSIIFPTATATVANEQQQNMATILGLLFAFGGIGGAIGPWFIGVASDWFGIQIGFAMSILFTSLVLLALTLLRRLSPE